MFHNLYILALWLCIMYGCLFKLAMFIIMVTPLLPHEKIKISGDTHCPLQVRAQGIHHACHDKEVTMSGHCPLQVRNSPWNHNQPAMTEGQGLKFWASSVQKASSFPIGLVVRVTWASSNKHFQPTIYNNSLTVICVQQVFPITTHSARSIITNLNNQLG